MSKNLEKKPFVIEFKNNYGTNTPNSGKSQPSIFRLRGQSEIQIRGHCHRQRIEGVDVHARKKLIIASCICLFFMVCEIIGGVLSNSLAIATDAAHLLSDFASFMISLFAIWIAGRPATQRMSFGWYRAEVIGALVSVFMIWVITAILVWMAIQRCIYQDYELDAVVMLITSGVAILVNFIWGIVGVGKISNEFCAALKSILATKNHKIVAVASRNLERSKEFSEIHGIPKYYKSYIDLAKDDAVEAVYIAVLNPYHYEVCKLMINHGKHVLCEKPLCMNLWQAREVLELASSKGVFLMEGIWSRFFPVYTHLKKLIDSGSLGAVKEVYIRHGFKGESVDRIVKKELGGGLVLDSGVYAIQFALFCFQEEPVTIKAKGTTNGDGVDVCFDVELEFSQKRFAKIICSAVQEYDNQAIITTTKGTVCIPMYFCPTSIVEPDSTIKEWPLPKDYPNSTGLAYEADAVYQCIRSGELYSSVVSPNESLLIATIQDEIRRQIGVFYACDKR